MKRLNDNRWMDDFGQVINSVHSMSDCAGEFCTIHKPSKHSMLGFPQLWRTDAGFMERVCPHGVGHPDPDDVYSQGRAHACDGCCLW
jgi:hypothetical protein